MDRFEAKNLLSTAEPNWGSGSSVAASQAYQQMRLLLLLSSPLLIHMSPRPTELSRTSFRSSPVQLVIQTRTFTFPAAITPQHDRHNMWPLNLALYVFLTVKNRSAIGTGDGSVSVPSRPA